MNRCLPVVLLMLALAVPAAADATTYGAQVGVDFLNQSRGVSTAEQVVTSLKALHAAGGRIGRADSDWAGTEPRGPVHGHHRYHWDYDDMIAGEMAKAHLRWEPTLELAPKWAQAHRPNVLRLKGGKFVTPLPPDKNSTFATYATAFMERYGVRRIVLEDAPKAAVPAGALRRGVERARQHTLLGSADQPPRLRADV